MTRGLCSNDLMLQRRELLLASTAFALGSTAAGLRAERSRIPLGFSLYGMRSLPLDDACRACREIGYQCIELPVMADWPADSLQQDDASLLKLAKIIATHKLRVAGLMENLTLAADDKLHEQNLTRLRGAGRVAQALGCNLVETVLGGAPQQWEVAKAKMATRLAEWAAVAREEKFMVAIKAHVGGAAHLPEHLIWLLEHTPSESLAAAYDPSHFALRGLSIADSWRPLAKRTKFIHVKDGQGTPEKPQFLLPGAGTLDLVELFRELQASNYSGDVVVEVSGQIHSQRDYDPIAAAKASMAALSKARG